MNKDEMDRAWESIIAPLADDSEDKTLDASARQMRKFYLSFKKAGFTNDESLRILAYGIFHRPLDSIPEQE